MMAQQKLAIIALGKQNAGKSNTWYELFGKTIRTGWKRLVLNMQPAEVYVRNSSYEEAGSNIEEDVFVRNSSFEEWGDEIEDYFGADDLPDIMFCSVQYIEKGLRTITWFRDNGYYLYIQWLNPGYYGKAEYDDTLGFEHTFSKHGTFVKCTGKEKTERAEQIRQFLVDWVSRRTEA